MGRLFGKFFGTGFLQEVPSGTVDGANSAFTLAQTPASSGPLLVFVDGVMQTDYTVSGATLTFSTAPSLGQAVSAYYLKQS